MEIIRKVQLLSKKDVNQNGLYQYDFLDLESNLPFSVYPKEKIKSYDNLEFYKVTDCKFNLVLQKVTNEKGTAILWKVKAGV